MEVDWGMEGKKAGVVVLLVDSGELNKLIDGLKAGLYDYSLSMPRWHSVLDLYEHLRDTRREFFGTRR